MSRSINPVMVTLARESRGWTQSELAHRMGDYQAKVSKIEAGLERARPGAWVAAICRDLQR